MGVKTFFAQAWPTRAALKLGTWLPPRAGHTLAAFGARLAVTLKPDIYYAVRHNQRHVLGPAAPADALERTTYRVFLNAARAYYHLFHNVGRGIYTAAHFSPPVHIAPETAHHIEDALSLGRGLFLLACHTSNMDMGGIALTQHLPTPPKVLSIAEPPPGFEVFNDLRRRCGVPLTPISPQSLREALHLLRRGGIVVTGPDRPVGRGDEPVTFFGATAYLPTGYLRMPLRTGSPVIVVATVEENGVYHVRANPPLELVRTGDRERDIAINLRPILDQVETFIRAHPDQWMMFVPVWQRVTDPVAGS